MEVEGNTEENKEVNSIQQSTILAPIY